MTTDTPGEELLIVTGMSGAGRSTAADALEDLGWYVVDNLPPSMIKPLVELGAQAGTAFPRLAAVVDIRGGRLFADLRDAIEALRGSSIQVRVLFLDADDDALVRRFEQVRRPHPLQAGGTLLEGIRAERAQLADLRGDSDIVLDTSRLNVHQLTTAIGDRFASPDAPRVAITVQSFGFKYGLPADADVVADMRFLPNPFWEPDLAPLDGRDPAVRAHVLGQPGAQDFLAAFTAALSVAVEGYRRENKRHVTVAVGCTGGKHRSVAMAEELADRLTGMQGVTVSVRHRDLGRE
ncbi:MAG: RNase adaptor protein RapZ [Micrococcales bacterium 73-13]|nr:MAG: RNase adaptor protein RapZ [Micrococcales bacterium 73-13]